MGPPMRTAAAIIPSGRVLHELDPFTEARRGNRPPSLAQYIYRNPIGMHFPRDDTASSVAAEKNGKGMSISHRLAIWPHAELHGAGDFSFVLVGCCARLERMSFSDD